MNSRQKRKEISSFSPELRLRDVPGKSVQWRRRGDWRVLAGGPRDLALVQAARGEVVRIARPPARLPSRLAPAAALARTGALPIAYARISTKPPVALAARARLRHAAIVPCHMHTAASLEVDCFSRATPDCSSRASNVRMFAPTSTRLRGELRPARSSPVRVRPDAGVQILPHLPVILAVVGGAAPSILDSRALVAARHRSARAGNHLLAHAADLDGGLATSLRASDACFACIETAATAVFAFGALSSFPHSMQERVCRLSGVFIVRLLIGPAGDRVNRELRSSASRRP